MLEKGILQIKKDESGKECWMPIARRDIDYKSPADIVGIFNAEIRGLYNYYALASNVSVLSKYRYVMEYSMYKTFASKYRCSMVSAKKKFMKNGNFTVPYTTQKGKEKSITFYNNGFRMKNSSLDKKMDILPQKERHYMLKPRELIVRMLKGQCELCETRDSLPKVYQVKKLSELSNETEWEALMLSKRRKVLIVCHDCYERIHS